MSTYIIYTIFNTKEENHRKLSQIRSYGIISNGLQNKFETAMVNEPLVFDPLKFYWAYISRMKIFFECQ